MTRHELAKMIDHTALKPQTTQHDILQLCREAKQFGFGAICIAPCWVSLAAEALENCPTRIASVIGFPHGNTISAVKSYEATQVLNAGADELDMVLNLGMLKSGAQEAVLHDVKSVAQVAHDSENTILKVILETAILDTEEKRLACRIAEEAGADFVKTSTGFGPDGATVEDVKLLREAVGTRLGVKAAGGIRDTATALAMIQAGANRLGCSASVSIMAELSNE